MSLGILQSYVPNQGDAWQYTLDVLSRFYEHALTRTESDNVRADAGRHPFELTMRAPDGEAQELIGEYTEAARRMGRRTAELHLALADLGLDTAGICHTIRERLGHLGRERGDGRLELLPHLVHHRPEHVLLGREVGVEAAVGHPGRGGAQPGRRVLLFRSPHSNSASGEAPHDRHAHEYRLHSANEECA